MRKLLALVLAALLMGAHAITPMAEGSGVAATTTVIVTTAADSGPGSLRQAVADTASGDLITFSPNLNGQTISLNNSLTITKNLTITGPGASQLALSGVNVVGVLAIRGGAEVTISGLTIRDGQRGIDNQGGALTVISSTISGNMGGAPWDGAGIYNKDGSLTLMTSMVSDNSVFNASGGGIANINGTITISESIVSNNTALFGGGSGLVNFSGSVVITNSTISGNTGHGHGLRNDGTLWLTNSTVSGNTGGGGVLNFGGILTITSSTIISNTATDNDGGGLHNSGVLTLINSTVSGNASVLSGGGIHNQGALDLNSVTLTRNTADWDGNGVGDGGGFSNFGVVNFKNTIVAGNTDNSATTKQPDLNCSGSVNSQGYNLIGNTTGCAFPPALGDQGGTAGSPLDPMLGLLQNNGGPTLTHALLAGSPAIEAGNPASPGSGGNACEGADQRGVARPIDGNNDSVAVCDIGAFEFVVFTNTIFLPIVMR